MKLRDLSVGEGACAAAGEFWDGLSAERDAGVAYRAAAVD